MNIATATMPIHAAQQPSSFALVKALRQPRMLVDLLRRSVAGGNALASAPASPSSPPVDALKGTMLDFVI